MHLSFSMLYDFVRSLAVPYNLVLSRMICRVKCLESSHAGGGVRILGISCIGDTDVKFYV